MNAGPHLAIGAACGLALTGGWSTEHAPAIGVCAVAALLPDLDHHSSLASNWLRTGLTTVALVASVVAATHTASIAQQPIGASILTLLSSEFPTVSAAQLLLLLGLAVGVLVFIVTSFAVGRLEPSHWVEHRGPLHAPIMLPIVGLTAGLLFGSAHIGLVVAAGWASHLVADAPSYRGLPLLWPYSTRMMHVTPSVFRWHSGTNWIEWPLALACLVLSTRLSGV